jgi:hypothetical protein
MPVFTERSRLTLLGVTAILSCFVGCSMFKEHTEPKLTAEVTPGSAPAAKPAASYIVEIRPENGKLQSVEKPLTDQTYIQTALDQTGASKKFKRASIEVFRPLPAGGWHKMNLELDKDTHRVPPEFDYAVLPGDRIVVIEDSETILDDIMHRAFTPLGITPPKKKDPLKEKYEIRG